MKTILLFVALSLVAVVAIVVVVGFLLPVEHVATVRAEYDVSSSELFDVVADYRRHPEWRPGVGEIEELEPRDGRPAWREVGATGPLPMVLTEIDPPHRMVTTILSDGMPFGGRWIYEVEDTPSGAALSITEEGEVYNPVFRFVSRFIMGHHGTATRYLEDLAPRLGAESVVVEVIR